MHGGDPLILLTWAMLFAAKMLALGLFVLFALGLVIASWLRSGWAPSLSSRLEPRLTAAVLAPPPRLRAMVADELPSGSGGTVGEVSDTPPAAAPDESVAAQDDLAPAVGSSDLTLVSPASETWAQIPQPHTAEGPRALADVPAQASFPFEGYAGPESFACRVPADLSLMTSGFGEVRNGNLHHAGVDYSQCFQTGYPVYTPFGGKVTFAGEHELFGWVVVIENNGWQVILAHNSELLVETGDLVNASDEVALAGSSGNSSGPHVHLEVRQCDDGGGCRPVNPSWITLPGQDALCPWESLGIKTVCPPKASG